MQFEVIGDKGTEWTDSPRGLTEEEAIQIQAVGRLEGIKLHRQFTHSTLSAAMRAVDALQNWDEQMRRELDDETCSSHPCPPLAE